MGGKPRPILAWHFAPNDRRMRYGDERLVEAGQTYTVDDRTPLRPCYYGLHASKQAIDALQYAPGNIISRVKVYPPIVSGNNKLVGYKRKHLWVADAALVLRAWARWCASEVLHLWEAPQVVKDYLANGDEKLRAVAWAAARDVARDAAWAAARDAAGAAARDAAKETQNDKLEEMLLGLAP